MEWVQTTGTSVEEALDKALDQLGVHEEDVEYEVLEEAKSGFLGRFGGSEARIRVRLKPISREKPQDRRRGRQRGGRKGGGDRPRKGRAEPSRSEEQKVEAETVDESNVSVEEQAEAAEEFVAGLIEAIGLEGDVRSSTGDDLVEVEVVGNDLGLLVGPKAATLGAIEELTRAVVQREAGGHAARVRVDVGGYRAKRRAALEDFTREIVAEVLESGEPRALEPMGSVDRKTVHDVVNDIDGVETSSEGEDPRRYVVIRRG